MVLVAFASRAFLNRKGWVALTLVALAAQATLSLTLRPDISACRPTARIAVPVQGTPVAWGPHQSVALAPDGWRFEGRADVPAPVRVALGQTGPLEQPAVGIVYAELEARPGAEELVLVFSPRSKPNAEDRVTRAVRIPVEKGVEQVRVQVDVAELLGGNWDGQAGIASVDLLGGHLQSLVLYGAGWNRQGPGGAGSLENDGVLSPGVWLREGVTARQPAPVDGELRYVGTGEARLEDGEVVLESDQPMAHIGDLRITEPYPNAPLVLLYMSDTLRADRSHTPTLERLRSEGLDFPNAWSTSSWTKPAIPTLMTGLAPSTHRVGATGVGDRLPVSVQTLADRFRENGWRTGSFSASPLGSTLSGLEQGFGTAYAPRHWGLDRGRHYPTAEQLHEALLEWLAKEPDQPTFAYVHAMDVHEYETRRGVVSLVSDYDDAVAEWDAALGRLLDALDRPVLTVVTSDHGESFWDHGVARHGTGLWASQTHIPLIIHGSGLTGSVDWPVSLVDVAPTLLSLVALPGLEADGVDALRRGGPVFSSLIRYTWKPDQPSAVSIIDGGLKRIEREDGLRQGFAIDDDPCEGRPIDSEALEALLREWQLGTVVRAEQFTDRHGSVNAGAVTTDDLERLKSLGYID